MFALDNHMLALGSCIAAFGILAAGLLALLFRNPAAPRWARPELVAMLACVPVTAIIGLGLGYTAYGVSQLVKGTGNPGELLVLAAVLIVLALAWHALGIRRRLQAYAAATGDISSTTYLATAPSLVIDETPPPPLKPPARPSSRRAA
jgi:heme A synthase